MPRKIKYLRSASYSMALLKKYLYTVPFSYNDARNKLLFSFFYYQGIKTSIVQKLTYNNYDSGTNILTLPLDNKLKKYIQIVPEDTTKNLLEYLLKFHHKENDRLIQNVNYKITRAGFPITIRQVQRIIREVGEKIGLQKGLNPRTLRHLCAVRLTKENLKHQSLDHLIGRVSPWVFTEYKRFAGNFKKQGEI